MVSAHSAEIGHRFQSIAATCSSGFRPPPESERSDAGFSIFQNYFLFVKLDFNFLMDSPFSVIL
jgi:hypothetical protein